MIARRTFLGWAGAAGAAGWALPGCDEPAEPAAPGGAEPGPQTREHAGETLRVFIYSGAWEKAFREHFVPAFQARTGATVIPDPGWWDSIPKLKASPPGSPAFDLVLTDATQGHPAIREGLFQTIDMNAVPNRSRLPPSVLDSWVYRDNYGITFPESVMTLGFNREASPIQPTSWADLLRPEVKGKVGLYNSFYMSLYTFAAALAAQEGKAGTAAALVRDDIQRVIDFAKAHRDRVVYWWPTSSDMALKLAQRECVLGNIHSPDLLSALRSQPALDAVVPAEDRAFVQLMWVIPAGTKVKSLAEKAIDFLFSDEIQEAFARNGSATVLPGVAAKVAAADPRWGSVYPTTAEGIAAVQYYPYDTYLANWDELVRVWDREILRS